MATVVWFKPLKDIRKRNSECRVYRQVLRFSWCFFSNQEGALLQPKGPKFPCFPNLSALKVLLWFHSCIHVQFLEVPVFGALLFFAFWLRLKKNRLTKESQKWSSWDDEIIGGSITVSNWGIFGNSPSQATFQKHMSLLVSAVQRKSSKSMYMFHISYI